MGECFGVGLICGEGVFQEKVSTEGEKDFPLCFEK